MLSGVFYEKALDTITAGPLRRLNIQPDRKWIVSLSAKWPLRGADLWHLAAAKTLAEQIPEMILLTLDQRPHRELGISRVVGSNLKI
jgi:hypothetical protein